MYPYYIDCLWNSYVLLHELGAWSAFMVAQYWQTMNMHKAENWIKKDVIYSNTCKQASSASLHRPGWLTPDKMSLHFSSCHCFCRHQLQCPGQYSPLEAFYEDKKAVLPPKGNGLVTACPTWSVTTINRCMHPEMKVWKQQSLYFWW